MDKTELLNNMRAGRARLESALAQVSQEQMTVPGLEGGWSVKDLLAHIEFWERRATTLFRILMRGEQPESQVDDASVDALNAKVYNENRERPLAEVQRHERE